MLDFIRCLLGISLYYIIILFINRRGYMNVFPDVGSFLPFGLSQVVLLQGEWASCVRREAQERFCHSRTVRGGHTPYPSTVRFSCSSLPPVSVPGPAVRCLSEECCVLQCCWYSIRKDALINGFLIVAETLLCCFLTGTSNSRDTGEIFCHFLAYLLQGTAFSGRRVNVSFWYFSLVQMKSFIAAIPSSL